MTECKLDYLFKLFNLKDIYTIIHLYNGKRLQKKEKTFYAIFFLLIDEQYIYNCAI